MMQPFQNQSDLQRDIRHFLVNGPAMFLVRRLKSHDASIYNQNLRSAIYSLQMARLLGYSEEEEARLVHSVLLQDVGMIHMNRNMTDQVLRHPIYSFEMVQRLDEAGIVDGEAILHHHENLDGTGYPFGVNWKDLSLNARILRVTSSFSGMTGMKASNAGVSYGEALEELYRWSDTMYDPDLVALLGSI